MYLMPFLLKHAEMRRFKNKVKNWKKDEANAADNDLLFEELVEGINY